MERIGRLVISAPSPGGSAERPRQCCPFRSPRSACLPALLGAALGDCVVSTEAELLALVGRDTCTLSADITLSSPVKPIAFQGTLNGQGHWIKGIDFDFQNVYDNAENDSSNRKHAFACLFPKVALLENVGLEFDVDFTNNIGEIFMLYLGAVRLSSGITVRNVAVNGTLAAKDGSETTTAVYVGGISGGPPYVDTGISGTLGPNVTSYCDIDCRSARCYAGAVAGRWNGTVTGAAAIGSTISVEASDYAYVGGLVGDLESETISESFADAREITVTMSGTRYVNVGGLAGCYAGTEVRDCYASVSTVSVTSPYGSSVYASPFLGEILHNSKVTRCYSRLGSGLSVSAPDGGVYVAGIVAETLNGAPSISNSFFLGEGNVTASAGRSLYVGGFCGDVYAYSSGATLSIQRSWSLLRLGSLIAGSSLYLGGACGRSELISSTAELADLDVMLVMYRGTGGAASNRYISALAGSLSSATVSGVLLRNQCGEGVWCDSLSLVAGGAATISGVNVVSQGWSVSQGVATGTITTVPQDSYAYPSYSGLSYSRWAFYDNGYPTLSTLPVPDRSGESDFASLSASSWPASTWTLPDAKANRPQLVSNKACKLVLGNALCASCPEGTCEECEGDATPILGGTSCLICPSGLEFVEEFGMCLTEDCEGGCNYCDQEKKCQECSGYTPYLDTVSSNPGKACLSAGSCAEAGGIADSSSNECREPLELCAGQSNPFFANCLSCTEVDMGGSDFCNECASGYLVEARRGSGYNVGVCISRDSCSGTSGPASDGKSCILLECSKIGGCIWCDPSAPEKCAECKEGYLVDAREGEPDFGWCISTDSCRRLAGPDSEGKRCIALGCSKAEHCIACDSSAPENCAECDFPYLADAREGEPSFGECISLDSCTGLSGRDEDGEKCVTLPCSKIEHCVKCDYDAPHDDCSECDSGYILDDREAMDGRPASPTLGKCIRESECGGTAGPNYDGTLCNYLQCARDPQFLRCDSNGGYSCLECNPPYVTYNGECTDNCMAGPSAVPNCFFCVEGTRTCSECIYGYKLVTTNGQQVCRKAGLSTGAIAGIAVAAVVVVGVIVGVSVFLCIRKRKRAGSAA